jgi:hypothetical protein
MTDTLAPVLPGWFTLGDKPQLLGTRCTSCGTHYFPKLTTFCKNPDCEGEGFEEVPLSRTGKLWSFTNASYKPPEPYISPEPFVPYAIAAVELDAEKMVVLGQVVAGVGVAELKAGMDMELVLEPILKADGGEVLTWKWKPAA